MLIDTSIHKTKKNTLMPLPLIPLIAAGSSLAGSIFNTLSQSSQNADNRDFSREMYNQQRKDNLSDYNTQNYYNSPTSQMKRFKDAGLNANLIYGGATQSSQSTIKAAAPSNPSTQAPRLDVGNAISSVAEIYQIFKTQADTDKLRQQVELLKEQQKLTIANTGNREFDLKYKSDIAPYQLGYADLKNSNLIKQNRQADANFDYTTAQNQRAWKSLGLQEMKTASDLKVNVEKVLTAQLDRAKTGMEILHAKQQLQNLNLSFRQNRFEFDRQLRTGGGVDKNSNSALKIIQAIIDTL